MGWYTTLSNMFNASSRLLVKRNSIQESSRMTKTLQWHHPKNIHQNPRINSSKSNIIASKVPSLCAPLLRYYRTTKNQQNHLSPFFSNLPKRYYCNLPPKRNQLIPIKTKKQVAYLALFLLKIVGIVLVVVTACFGRFEKVPYSKRWHLVFSPPGLERMEGEHGFKLELEKYAGNILSETDPRRVRVKAIASDIIEAIQRDAKDNLMGFRDNGNYLNKFNWEVMVIDWFTENAFCYPDGKIVVFTGLLKFVESDAEIATIVGHEIGHVIARHIAESFAYILWMILALGSSIIAPELISKVSKYGPIGVTLCKCVLTGVMCSLCYWLMFPQRIENEADYIGLLLMASAGYDPRSAPEVYEKLEILSRKTKADEYFSTDPTGKNRAQLLNEVMDEAPLYITRFKHEETPTKKSKVFFLMGICHPIVYDFLFLDHIIEMLTRLHIYIPVFDEHDF